MATDDGLAFGVYLVLAFVIGFSIDALIRLRAADSGGERRVLPPPMPVNRSSCGHPWGSGVVGDHIDAEGAVLYPRAGILSSTGCLGQRGCLGQAPRLATFRLPP